MKGITVTYSIIIIHDVTDNDVPYLVKIPSLNGCTQGTSIKDAINMAHDYIGFKIMDMLDYGHTLPKSDYKLPTDVPGQITKLITVNIDKYRHELHLTH